VGVALSGYALEIPLLRTIFYLFNWVEAGFLNRTLSSRLKPIPYTVGGFGLRMKSGVSLLPFFVFPFLFGGLYLGASPLCIYFPHSHLF
jgi:hypothetical protein